MYLLSSSYMQSISRINYCEIFSGCHVVGYIIMSSHQVFGIRRPLIYGGQILRKNRFILFTLGIINCFALSNLDIYLYANSAHRYDQAIDIHQYILIVGRSFTTNISLFVHICIHPLSSQPPTFPVIYSFNIRVLCDISVTILIG